MGSNACNVIGRGGFLPADGEIAPQMDRRTKLAGQRNVHCLPSVHTSPTHPMNNPLRGLLAGAAAYKWGGGCFGTVIVFLIVYWLLGSC